MSPFAAGTWSQLPAPPGGTDVGQPNDACYSESQDVLILSTAEDGAPAAPALGGAIHRSMTRGVTWATVFQGTSLAVPPATIDAPFVVDLLRDPVTGAEVFLAIVRELLYTASAVTSVVLRVYRSTNGAGWAPGQALVSAAGAPFVTWAASPFTIIRANVGADQAIFVFARAAVAGGGATRGCFRSLDNGLTWTLISDPGPFDFTDLITLPDQSAIVASRLGSPARISRSFDGGVTWTPTATIFAGDALAAFAGGPMVCMAQGTLTGNEDTRVSCDEGLTWPHSGVAIDQTSGAVVSPPVLIRLSPSTWEVLLINGRAAGRFAVCYSDTGGELGTVEEVQAPDGVFFQSRAGVKLVDGHPLLFRGGSGAGPGQTWISSDVPPGTFGTRIFCITAPAPGAGILGFPEPCGDFYNPCPQECPTDPAAIEGLVVAIPSAVVLGDSWPFGDEELTCGDDAAIYGGDPNSILSFPVLGLPAGCGHTFVNEPCAVMACPV